MGRVYKTRGPFICQNPHCGKSFMGYPGGVNRVCSKQCCKRKHPRRYSQCTVCQKDFEVKNLNHNVWPLCNPCNRKKGVTIPDNPLPHVASLADEIGRISYRTASTGLLTYKDRTMSIAEWSRELGIKRTTLDNRIARHWSIERALTNG